VHRDLKPENVMLVKEQSDPDFPKLLDLGIAKLVAPEDAKRTRLTQKGELIGTPHYISPEVLRGENIDGRSDLYSLSVMLYEMLAARPPFESTNTMGLFAMHLASPPPPLSEVAPDLDVPATLEQLLSQGLAKEPAARMPSADSYRERIEELLRLDWSKLPKAAKGAVASGAAPRLKLQRGQARPSAPAMTGRTGQPAQGGLFRQALQLVVRSPTTAITIVLVILAVAGLCYWVARDLTFGP
jgi:serine/threonine-protein kinase